MMECFYYEELKPWNDEVLLSGEEFKHLKALRIQKGDRVCLINGQGLSAFGFVKEITKTHYTVKILNFVENLGEIDRRIALALCILDNKERFEFAFEKGIEFRISEFYPVITKYTQRRKVDMQRLARKGIAAIKQTHRSKLPMVSTPIELNELMKKFREFDKVFVFHRGGKPFNIKDDFHSALVIIGPEGGFSESEMKTLSRRKKVEIVSICDYPLRSETAVVAALSMLTYFLE